MPLLLLSVETHSYRIEDLYAAVVVVPDQSSEERRRGFRAALGEVLIKLSADPGILSQPVTQPLLRGAETFMQSYRYRARPPEEEAEPGAPAVTAPGFLLEVSFQEEVLARELRANGVSVWGRERPLLLVWMVVADAVGSKEILDIEADSPFPLELQRQAQGLGLPLLFPLLDLEDDRNLGVAELWADLEDRIRAASRRYGADAVLTVRLQGAASSSYQAAWVLYLQDDRREWQSQGARESPLFEAGLKDLLVLLQQSYGRVDASGDEVAVDLNVTGVMDFEHYLEVLHYLQRLDVVLRVEVTEFHADRVHLRLFTRFGAEAVHSAIALGRVLSLAAGPEAGWYRLRPQGNL